VFSFSASERIMFKQQLNAIRHIQLFHESPKTKGGIIMKYRIFIFSLVGAALILFGCGKDELVSPQLAQNEQEAVLAKKGDKDDDDIKGPFTATVDLNNVTNPGQVEQIGGKLKIRGQVNEGPFVAGDIEGTATAVTDAEIDLATGTGSGRGSFTFKVTKVKGQVVSGSWKGKFKGQINGPVFSGNFSGRGKGDLEDTKIKGTFTDGPTGDNFFQLTGRIREDDD
jgi:hypothetical protein